MLEFRPAVRSWLTVTMVAALGAALLTSISTATSVPYLRAVSVHNRHVVAVFTLGDLAPDHIAVASSPQTQANGAFVRANVRLQEALPRLTRVPNGYRVQTRHTLGAGRYYVKVSGLVVGLDCTKLKPCRQDWSNVRRIVIPRPG